MSCDHLPREGLAARELGLPDDHVASCWECRTELEGYRFVEDIGRLVEWSPAPPGWERRVWAAIDQLERPRWRRWLAMTSTRGRWLVVPLVSAAVVTVIVVRRPTASRSALSMDLAVRAQLAPGGPRRALVASVGDEVTVRAAGADAIWVYLDGGALIERCPGTEPGRCDVSPGGVELTVRLSVAARHRVLAILGARDLTPSGDFDRDVLAARAAGARLELRSILVAGP